MGEKPPSSGDNPEGNGYDPYDPANFVEGFWPDVPALIQGDKPYRTLEAADPLEEPTPN